MQIYYYYHISKTGGTSMLDFFNHIVGKVPNSVVYDYNDWDKLPPNPKDIDFDRILSEDNVSKYDYIFIHHHHGYRGLLHYREYLIRKKEELKRRGHRMKIFTTIRDVVSFNNSRLNYLRNARKWKGGIADFLTNEIHFNVQTKYLLFCWHGEWPSTIDVVNEEVNEKNIDKLAEVIDLFVEISHLSEFIQALSGYFKTSYNSSHRSNTSVHHLNFDSHASELLRLNKMDCYLLQKYSNKDFKREVDDFLNKIPSNKTT